MSVIELNNGGLSIDGQVLPCVMRSVSLGGKVLMDSSNVQGASGKKSVFNGYDDSSIDFELELLEPLDYGKQRYESLKVIHSAFKNLENGEPKVYSVQSVLFEAMSIESMVFRSLSVSESLDRDSLKVSVHMIEFDAPIVQIQEQETKASDENTLSVEASTVSLVNDNEIQAFKEGGAL